MFYINISLIFIAGLNVGLALFIWLRNPKNKINIYYSLGVFFIGLWALGASLFREADGLLEARIWTWFQNGFGALIVIPLLFFSINFPYASRKVSILQKILIWISILAVLYVAIIPGVWYTKINLTPHANDYEINLTGYLYFLIFLLFYLILSFIILIKKYFKSEGFQKTQLKYLIIASGITGVFATINSAILPIWLNAEYNWIGPLFSLPLIVIVSYFLFKKE